MPRCSIATQDQSAFIYSQSIITADQQMREFRQRQREDLRRFDHVPCSTHGGGGSIAQTAQDGIHDRSRRWRDSEGECLEDFGVDEEVEFNDDNVPLSELLRKRRGY